MPNNKTKLKERANQLKIQVPAVFVVLKMKQTPWYAKVFAVLTVAYALSPIDFVPDFIPVLGYLDDLILLPALVALTVKCIPKAVWEEGMKKSQGMWENGKPKKWYFAIPIVLIWVLIIFLVVKFL